MRTIAVRAWCWFSLAQWLYRGPYPLRRLAYWWLPRWYSVGIWLEGDR